MVCDDTRHVVIIKNISSNIVEEAILVLKDKRAGKNIAISSASNSEKQNNYLIKEAEDIINNYIRGKNLKGGVVHKLNLKPFNPEKKLVNTVINIILVASIALLFFLVAKIF